MNKVFVVSLGKRFRYGMLLVLLLLLMVAFIASFSSAAPVSADAYDEAPYHQLALTLLQEDIVAAMQSHYGEGSLPGYDLSLAKISTEPVDAAGQQRVLVEVQTFQSPDNASASIDTMLFEVRPGQATCVGYQSTISGEPSNSPTAAQPGSQPPAAEEGAQPGTDPAAPEQAAAEE